MVPVAEMVPLAKFVSYLSVELGKSAVGLVIVNAPEPSHQTTVGVVVSRVEVAEPNCTHLMDGAPPDATAPE
jgi:hypothetical protein